MSGSENGGDRSRGGRQRAVRLVVAYDADGLRVVSRRHLRRVLPMSEPLDVAERRAGFRVEVRDPDDRVRYVRFTPDPRTTGAEVPPAEDDGPFTRTGATRESGTFALLVPDLPDGGDVVLTRRSADPGARTMRTDEVARLPLRGESERVDPAGPAQPASACNRVIGSTKIRDNGPDPDRWNVVILGDGYRDEELDGFASHADFFADALLDAAPFDELRDGINVHRVDVASCDSGADHPDGCDDGVVVDTYFDATFCLDPDWPERLLVVDTATVINVLEREVPDWDVGLVVVNSTVPGGSGDDLVPVTSMGSIPGVALHEIGHSAFGLADEYDFHYGPDDERDFEDPDYRRYEGDEPEEPNLTAATTRRGAKWDHLVPVDADLPTVTKDDCEESDWGSSNPAPPGTVGLFEGAGYHRCGLYRAQFDCRMRRANREFCPVCRERIHETLAPFITHAEGVVSFLRVHDVGSGYGPDRDHLDVEVVIRLDTAPDRAFGFRLRDDEEEASHRRMLDALRTAFNDERRIEIEYRATGARNGELLAVEALKEGHA